MTYLPPDTEPEPRDDADDAAGLPPAPPEGAAVQAQALPRNLAWSVVKNVVSQGAGRILIALSHLVVAGMIVRTYGAATFGAYAVVLMILVIAEWLLDFGVTDVSVREICRNAARRKSLLRIVTAAKVVQVLVAYIVLAGILLALRYPAEIARAGLVGGMGLVFYGGVLIYRALFKSSLRMERDVGAELIAALTVIPLVWLACSRGASLSVLVGCHVVSRAVFLGCAFLFGRSDYRPSVKGVTWNDIRWSLRASAAIGAIGLLVVVYEALDVVLLSKLGTPSDLGYYASAQKLVWPALMALASVGATLYPITASYWPHSRDKFEQACQRALNTVMVLGGLAMCSLVAGSEFFMGLIGPDVVGGTPALWVLALLCCFKVVGATLGPVLFVLYAQRRALQYIAVAVVAKAIVVALLVPRFGFMGVAFGALGVEVIFATVPCVYLLQKFSGYRIRWGVPIKTVAIAAAAATIPWLIIPRSRPEAAIAAAAIYIPLAFLSRSVRMADIRLLLSRRKA